MSTNLAVADSPQHVLEVEKLSVIYKRVQLFRKTTKVHALSNVSFKLGAGEVLAIVGESGCGKSTLAKALMGLTSVSCGKIDFSTDRAPKRAVRMIFQDPFASLNPMHSVRYILTRPIKLHRQLSHNEIEPELHRVLSLVKLDPPADFLLKYPHELSGGQRQRINIARAICAAPEIVIADEPTSMLDVSVRIAVMNGLLDIRSRLGFSMIYITHDLAGARYVSDRVLVLYRGEIMEMGEVDQVIQSPRHPYTALLKWASPGGQGTTDATNHDIPVSATQTVGCSFFDRCPRRSDRCSTEKPPLVQSGDGRSLSCHHPIPETV